MPQTAASTPLRTPDAVRTWAPLAASWLLMGLELPLVSAVVARLPGPEIGLAAYGGVVFPLALLIESPVIMLLSASTALSRDARAYATGRRVMRVLGIGFSSLHALVAFTPLYDVLARRVLHVPDAVVEPARIGLRIMTPWTASIAYRRFQQGVLIRFGRAREVSYGTAIRLATDTLVLVLGAAVLHAPGIVVATTAVTSGVVAEAVFAAVRVRSTRRGALAAAPQAGPPLTTAAFLRFYVPLMLTPVFLFLVTPLTSAAMSRMPRALDSLATWPVVMGLVFTLRSAGFALNEAVVALLDRAGAWRTLRRVALAIAVVTSALLLLVAATPLAGLWLGRVSALPPRLVALGAGAAWIAVLVPGLTAIQSLYQGALVHAHATRAVSESVALLLAVTAAVLVGGVAWARAPGLPVALVALAAGQLAQVAWLRFRARGVVRALSERDRAATTAGPATPARA